MEVAKGAPQIMRFDETELRLGLPGGGGGGGGAGTEAAAEVVGSNPTTPTHAVVAMMRKRGFSETVDLQLNLSSPLAATATTTTKEPQSSTTAEDCASAAPPPSSADKMDKSILIQPADPAKPPAKAQVVGWPPVRSFRKNMVSVQKSSTNVTSTTTKDMSPGAAAETEQKAAPAGVGASFVKVSMDGAPYLRKVDLKMYGSYRELSDALAKMFGGSGKDANDYVPTYEDKDGDWMLVGDVPWGMFVESCKRLRIMKGNEAIGLAPRGMEKRKNMS